MVRKLFKAVCFVWDDDGDAKRNIGHSTAVLANLGLYFGLSSNLCFFYCDLLDYYAS